MCYRSYNVISKTDIIPVLFFGLFVAYIFLITYSLISQEMKEEFKESEGEQFYQLLMPKNEYHKYYRQTLIPSHLKTIKYNLSHGNKNLFFFEISSVASLSQQEDLLILSGTGKLTKQPFHQLTQAIDFY